MKIRILMGTVFVMAACGVSASQQISRDQFLRQAAKRLPRLKSAAQKTAAARQDVRQNRSYLDPQFSVSTSYTWTTQHESATVDDVQKGALEVGVSQTDPLLGGVWTASVSGLFSRTTGTVKTTDPLTGTASEDDYKTDRYAPSLTIGASLPLLRNVFNSGNRALEMNSRLAEERQRLHERITRYTTLANFEKIYFQLHYYRVVLDLIETALKNAEATRVEHYRKYRDGMIDKDQYQTARSAVFRYRDLLASTRLSFRKIRAQLEPLGLQNIVPEKQEWHHRLRTAAVTPKKRPSYRRTLRGQSEYLAVTYSRGVHTAAVLNGLPDLSLDLSATYSSADNTWADAIDDIRHTRHSVSLNIAVPLGNTRADSEARRAAANAEAARHDLTAARQEYRTEYDQRVHSLEAGAARLENKQDYIQSLSLKYYEERKKYRRGQLSLSDLLRTRNSMIDERINAEQIRLQLISDAVDLYTLIR